MSHYVDTFIKDHREYFTRNKSIIENNNWNDTEQYNSKINSFTEQLYQIQESKDKDKEKKIKEIESNIKKYLEISSKNKRALFKQENKLTNSIVGRLSEFILETQKSGDRKQEKEKVQKFIDFTVDIIQIHLKKCTEYLRYGSDIINKEAITEDEIEYNDHEIDFQDDIFLKKVDIQNTLNSLNIAGEVDNTKIEFFKDQKATIPMMTVLPLFNDDIKELTEKIGLSDEIYDKEFLIHKDPKDIPKWEDKKHYWEQKPETLKFWYNEWMKITNGFEVDGYFFHPWLYYHLNYFKTPIPQADGKESVVTPMFRDNEHYIAELLKKAEEKKNRGVLLYGSRRIAKSTDMASVCEWKALVKDNASTAITSGSAGDLAELAHKIKTSMKFKVPAFKLPIQKQEWDGGTVELGLKWDASTLLEHSRHTIKNLSSGATSSTQKSAGGAPSVYLIEEIGKFAWEKSYLAAQPSFETEFGWKSVVIAVGTSGEASLSGDAMRAVTNPDSFKFLEMDWDEFESYLPVGYTPTWKRRTFANFVPAQMAYKTGFKRIERKFGEYLGIKSEYLDKITIYQTDWVNNTRVLLEDRERVKKDALKYQQECVQYPMCPTDCFLSANKNPYPAKEAQLRKEYLLQSGEWDRRRVIYRGDDGKLKSEFSDMPLAEYPHKGGTVEAPILIFEDIPEVTPVENLYVASFDDVKQDDSDTDSVICFQIWKMETFNDEWGGRLVVSWSCRPENRKPMYEKWLLLQQAYNARAFPENEDMGYKTFLEGKHLEEKWLISAVDFTSNMGINSNNKRKFGWTPRQSKKVLLGLSQDKFDNELYLGEDENGSEIMVKEVSLINDIVFLDEIINYNEDANVDRLSASLGAIGWMHYLRSNFITPKHASSNLNQEQKKPHIKRVLGGSRRSRLLG